MYIAKQRCCNSIVFYCRMELIPVQHRLDLRPFFSIGDCVSYAINALWLYCITVWARTVPAHLYPGLTG